MDYLTFTERLNLILSLSNPAPAVSKEVKAFLSNPSSGSKSKSLASDLLLKLFLDPSSSSLVLDLYRDLLPGLVSKFLHGYVLRPTPDGFCLAGKLYVGYQAFRPLITSALAAAHFNPILSLSDSASKTLIGLHNLISASGTDYVTGLWDCSGLLKGPPSTLDPVLKALWKSISLKIVGYPATAIETALGIEQTTQLADWLAKNPAVNSAAAAVIDENPVARAHVLEPPNEKDPFLSNAELAEGSEYVVPELGLVRAQGDSKLVYTKTLKRVYKTLLQLIVYDSSKPILLSGPQGTGKTSLIEQLAEDWSTSQGKMKVGQPPKLIQIYMDETLDTKSLIGTFVCAESYGEFVFKKGPLASAAEQGWWIILENIDKANDDITNILAAFIDKGEIALPTREGKVTAHEGFRIFATSQGSSVKSDHQKSLSRYFHVLNLPEYSEAEAKTILKAKFQMFDFEDLLRVLYGSVSWVNGRIKAKKAAWGRPITFTDLMKVSRRIESAVEKYYNGEKKVTNGYLVEQFRMECVFEIYDCLLSYIDTVQERLKIVEEICGKEHWNVDPVMCVTQLTKVVPKMQYTSETFTMTVGRCSSLHFDSSSSEKSASEAFSGTFAYTSYALRGFESISQAIKHNEALLLVGPTGVGKTLIVQQLARMMNKKLVVYNMNCMSDASDLMGGFKPIAPKYILLPFVEGFLKLFCEVVNRDSNQAFIATLTAAFNKNQYAKVFKCVDTALAAMKGRPGIMEKQKETIGKVQEESKELQKKLAQMKGHFAYQYVEGALVKSLQNGDWVLLDELNLASDELLQKLAPLIENRSLTVTDRSDLLPVKRHPHFRLICCMNPGGTVGKRQLPTQIRSKFTEIFMGDLEDESDILYLIKHVSGELNDDRLVTGLTKFYVGIKTAANQMQLQMVNGKKPTFSVRNLCRAVDFIRRASTEYGLANALKDGIDVCLLSQLNAQSKATCQKLLASSMPFKMGGSVNATPKDGCVSYVGYNLPRGKRTVLPSEDPDKWFVTTASFEESLRQLAKIVANTQLPILLEGQTSSGKTAMIEYLACKTYNHCIRINNHLNTDVQEYIGSYVPDQTGKLYFQEGALIEAVRNGYWVILDELNLAPSEVLEALNRLLDDNREIYIAETQTMLKAHPMFRVFATQNPTEGYGGRKELSEAFRNRFISLFIPEIPLSELATVVEKRCSIPPSFAKRMVSIMEELQLNRRESDILSGKQSFITVRDLIKWATRPIVTMEDVAYEGYMLLAERLRNAEEKAVVRKIIEKHCKARLEVKGYYDRYCQSKEVGVKIDQFNEKLKINPIGGLTKISWTNSMKRLYALTDKCVKNKEPVLLVGETGCGKTTVCQLISLFEDIPMYTISCHQNSEASDFIGGLRTVTGTHSREALSGQIRAEMDKIIPTLTEHAEEAKALIMGEIDFKAVRKFVSQLSHEKSAVPLAKINEALNAEGKIFEWKNGPLVKAMVEGGILLIDEISLTDDSVIERINSVLEKERVLVLSEKSSESVERYVAHDRFCVLATMNPGGDYGKKELSPALRNRFTEIWVDSFFTDEDFLLFAKRLKSELPSQSATNIVWTIGAEHIDLYQVIREKLVVPAAETKEKLSKMVLQFACWYNQIFIKEMNIERKALSLRDVLSLLEFVSTNYSKMADGNCYLDSVSLIILDGIATNSDVGTGQSGKISAKFTEFVIGQIGAFGLEFVRVDPVKVPLVDGETTFGMEPYVIPKTKGGESAKGYALEVKTPKENLHRILRAMSLNKPVLLEGSPGVGKTSLLEHLAKITGRHVVSVSLSEQTDMMDLLGCEYPVTSEHSVSNKPEFKWCDGILLRAVKEGWWVLIDELNLASQSVLEGLNAILDHRKTIFIPELNAEYQCHPDFRFFATQSPARQGASRKNLPKSFMNRFAKIYLDSLTEQDLVDICRTLYPAMDPSVPSNLVRFNEKCRVLKEGYHIQSNLEYNLRDVKKALAITQSVGLLEAVDIIYLRNLRLKADRKAVKKVFEQVFGKAFAFPSKARDVSLSGPVLTCGNARCEIGSEAAGCSSLAVEGKTLIGKERKMMEDLLHCMSFSWPVMVTGPESSGKTMIVKKLAALSGHKVVEIIVGGNTDSTELLGFYEQANISTLLLGSKERIENMLHENFPKDPVKVPSSVWETVGKIENCRYRYKKSTTEWESIEVLKEFAQLVKSCFEANGGIAEKVNAEIAYLEKLQEITKGGKFVGRFEWIDSELVKGVQNGSWVIIKNANACSASILDRINPLLDEDNKLIINEAGIIGDKFRVVERHPRFRLFFVYDYKLGELSRSLRNRCVELCIRSENEFAWSTEPYPVQLPLNAALTEQPIWIDSVHKSLAFRKSYVEDTVQLLRRTGIPTQSDAVSMLVWHHAISELTQSSATEQNRKPSIRQLITWGKLFVQMAAVTSDRMKALKWSFKIAYSEALLKLGHFPENFTSTFSQKEPASLGLLPRWEPSKQPIPTGLEKAYASFIKLHDVEAMLSAPARYWEKYATCFMDLLEFSLAALEAASDTPEDYPSNQSENAVISGNSKKRTQSEKSADPHRNLLLRSGLHRVLSVSGLHVSPEKFVDAILKMLPIAEREANRLFSKETHRRVFEKIIVPYCSEINKGLRTGPNRNLRVIQTLTASDIELGTIGKQMGTDLNSYFPKKLGKLRRLVQGLVSRIPQVTQTVEGIIRMLDYANKKALQSHSGLGLVIFPCMQKLEKELTKLGFTGGEARLTRKIKDKALASSQLDKAWMAPAKKNPTLAEMVKKCELDRYVPRNEAVYKKYRELLKVLSPLVQTVGNRQEPGEYRIGRNEEIVRLVKQCLEAFHSIQHNDASVSLLETALAELSEKYQAAVNTISASQTEIVIALSDLEEQPDPDDQNEDGTVRIPIIEHSSDMKRLKTKHLVDFTMLLKDSNEIRTILAGQTSTKLLDRYAKRRTLLVSQILSGELVPVLAHPNPATRNLWKYCGVVLSKALTDEYLWMAQKGFSTEGPAPRNRLMLAYVNEKFVREMKLAEISYKMDYMLKLKNQCYLAPEKDTFRYVKMATFCLTAVILPSVKDEHIKGMILELVQLAEQLAIFENRKDMIHEALKNLNACLTFVQKWSKTVPELTELFEGICGFIRGVFEKYQKNEKQASLATVEGLKEVCEMTLHVILGKVVLWVGYPAVNLAKQIKLPVYIEYSEEVIHKIYEDVTIEQWIYENRNQTISGEKLTEMKAELEEKIAKWRKYKGQYRYRDVSQLGALVSLIDSLEINSTSSKSLLNALTVSNAGEIAILRANIVQALIKILTHYLDCNQDVLTVFVIGLGTILKAYSKAESHSLQGSFHDPLRVIKCGTLDYHFSTGKSQLFTPVENYSEALSKAPSETAHILQKQFITFVSSQHNPSALAKLEMEYLNQLIDQYFALENKATSDEDPTYKYHGQSLAEKIMGKYKAIDEMTKAENTAKKAAEKRKELEDEFSEFLSPEQSLEKFVRKVKALPEKVEEKIHAILSGKNDTKGEQTRMIKMGLKMAKKTGEKIPSRECMLQSAVLMQDCLQVLNTRIENIDDGIRPPNETYHFYKDANPAEVKLVHNPVMQLLARLHQLLKEYPNNLILQTTAQMCDKLLSFDLWKTPVSRVMAGLELVVNKAHEWQALASKRLNSIDTELGLIYRVVVRYRKLQLLSWNSLLKSKREDYEKSPAETRLTCLIITRVFDAATKSAEENVDEIYKSIDRYILGSTMATFPYRYNVIRMLHKFVSSMMTGEPSPLRNMLRYVTEYYQEYVPIYEAKFKEVHKPTHDKMTELIKISKWDVSNYYAFHNCITHNHIQLLRIIKDYDDVLKLPFTTTVFVSHRNSTVLSESHVFGLSPEKPAATVSSESPWEEMTEAIHDRIAEVKESESKAVRRRALVDLFKKLKEEKISAGYRKLLAEGHLYQREHFDPEAVLSLLKTQREKPAKIAKYYYGAVDNVNVMFSLPAFHEHLSPQEIEVMKGFGYNLLYVMVKYAGGLAGLAREQALIKKMIDQLPECTGDTIYPKSAASPLVTELSKLCDSSSSIVTQLHSLITKYQPSHPVEHLQAFSDKFHSSVVFQSLAKDPIAYDKGVLQSLSAVTKELAGLLQKIVETTTPVYSETVLALEKHAWVMNQKAYQLDQFLLSTPAAVSSIASSVTEVLGSLQEKLAQIPIQAKEKSLSGTETEQSMVDSLKGIAKLLTENIMLPLVSAPEPASIAVAREGLRNIQTMLEGYLNRAIGHAHVFSKVTHLITTVFCNLLKNGFCIHDAGDDEGEAAENQKMIEEVNGMGLGEGVGRQDVSEQVEHEEQIEGLKGDQQEDQEAPEGKKELDKGFEMEEDFQGDIDDLGEEGKKEAEEKKEGDLQREMDEDMGKGEENKLWNDENELPEEDKEEEQKEPQGETQDLTDKKVKPGKDQEKQMKADESQKPKKGDDDQQQEEEPEGEEEGKEEEKKEFEEAAKDDEFHLEKDQRMEGLESDKEDEQKDNEELSLSMNSEKEEEPEEKEDESLAEDGPEKETDEKPGENPEEGSEVPPEVDQEVDNGKPAPENKEEEEKKEEPELPKGAPSNAPNPSAETMPFGEQEDVPAAGRESNDNKNEMMYSQFDIARVVNERFEKGEAKKKQAEEVKGKLGDNKKETNKNLTITTEPNRPTEDRKPMDDDEVMVKDENEPEDAKEQAQAIGETMMEIGNQNVADDAINPDEGAAEDEQKGEEEKAEEMKDVAPEKVPEASKVKDQKRPQKGERTQKHPPEKVETMEDLVEDAELAQPAAEQKVQPSETPTPPKEDKPAEKTEEPSSPKESPYMSPEKYEEEKTAAMKEYYEWLAVPEKSVAANEMLQRFENLTRGLSASLCEQLRILLEPTQRTKLKGDYKTGKRLNMKKIIPFLASNYRNDKIWMRRSVPNKRDYKIMLMIDDSLSMKEHGLGFFALESVMAILQAVDVLEIGEVCVGAMRDNLKIVHGFHEKYSRQKAAYILSSFGFDYNEVNSADNSLATCVNDANHILEMQHFDSRTISIILSDGRFNKSNVKPFLVDAADKGHTYVMIILDNYGKDPSKSILNMKSTKWVEKGGKRELEIVPHLQDFPFEFYCVLQDIAHLPFTLSSVLLNWFKQAVWN